jgi:hypothetical protein
MQDVSVHQAMYHIKKKKPVPICRILSIHEDMRKKKYIKIKTTAKLNEGNWQL